MDIIETLYKNKNTLNKLCFKVDILDLIKQDKEISSYQKQDCL